MNGQTTLWQHGPRGCFATRRAFRQGAASPGRAIPGTALLIVEIADRHSGHSRPQRVIRCKHPVIPMPMLSRWRNECYQPIQKLKRAEVDNATRRRPR